LCYLLSRVIYYLVLLIITCYYLMIFIILVLWLLSFFQWTFISTIIYMYLHWNKLLQWGIQYTEVFCCEKYHGDNVGDEDENKYAGWRCVPVHNLQCGVMGTGYYKCDNRLRKVWLFCYLDAMIFTFNENSRATIIARSWTGRESSNGGVRLYRWIAPSVL